MSFSKMFDLLRESTKLLVPRNGRNEKNRFEKRRLLILLYVQLKMN